MTRRRTVVPVWVDRSLFPFDPFSVDLPEGRVSYVDEGSGPPVVLVHGTPGWGFEYRDVVPLLAPRRRVLVPDLLGFGLSDRIPGGDYTVAGHARRLGDFLERLDLHDAHMVVHDFGGPIGFGTALDHPERVSSITAVNTWAWPLNGDPTFERTKHFTGRIGRFLYHRLNFSARTLVPQAFSEKSRLSPEVHRHYIEAQDRDAREAAFTFAGELLGAGDHLSGVQAGWDTLAPRIRTMVWGMADKLLRPDHFLPRWRELCPDIAVVEVPDVGHYVQEEAPERVATAVLGAESPADR
jgi:pimeloyl-ACP methyl ester carboxylesterase